MEALWFEKKLAELTSRFAHDANCNATTTVYEKRPKLYAKRTFRTAELNFWFEIVLLFSLHKLTRSHARFVLKPGAEVGGMIEPKPHRYRLDGHRAKEELFRLYQAQPVEQVAGRAVKTAVKLSTKMPRRAARQESEPGDVKGGCKCTLFQLLQIAV